MLHFVRSYMKQNESHKQTLESAQNGLEIILKERGHFVMLVIKSMHLINLHFWTYLPWERLFGLTSQFENNLYDAA